MAGIVILCIWLVLLLAALDSISLEASDKLMDIDLPPRWSVEGTTEGPRILGKVFIVKALIEKLLHLFGG
jgi:hypothetical protein